MVLLTSALLGALVGLLKLRAATAPALRVVLPIVAAVLVSLLVFAVAPETKTQESLREPIPPLITFLPGGLITSATLDLVRPPDQRRDEIRRRLDAARAPRVGDRDRRDNRGR
jgi:hypothetical protein